MQRGLVISDLHLFSPRSRAEELFATVCDQLKSANTLVLNGDIFDFRWSTLPDTETTTAAALSWLKNLVDRYPNLTIHYLLGNHDCVTGFTQELFKLAESCPSLRCHEFFLQIGNSIFLHGDCANRRMDANELRRFRDSWSQHSPCGQFRKKLYEFADAAGVSKKFHDWWFPQHDTVCRVAYHLDGILPDWRNQFDHCYFGHTHLPFRNHNHEGVMFHNTGSAIRNMGFQPLGFDDGNE